MAYEEIETRCLWRIILALSNTFQVFGDDSK
jgi:hypothetical protein